MREAIKFVGGSVAVYLVMVACSTSRGEPLVEVADRGTGGARSGAVGGGSGMSNDEPSNGGMMGSAGEVASAGERGTGRAGSGAGRGPTDGGIVDAMTDPTPDAMAQTEPTSGSRLKARYLVGDDGSKQWNYGWYDTQRKENCSFSTLLDGETRCLPSAGATSAGSYFGDEGCSKEVVMVVTSCSAAIPTYVSRSVLGACNTYEASFHEIGSKMSSTTYYIKSGTSCVGEAVPDGEALYTIGDEIPATAFVKATEDLGT